MGEAHVRYNIYLLRTGIYVCTSIDFPRHRNAALAERICTIAQTHWCRLAVNEPVLTLIQNSEPLIKHESKNITSQNRR
jgi:hypothetical protein